MKATARVLCLLMVAPVAAQQPRDAAPTIASGTASVAGVIVTDEPTPAPVRRAIVTISGSELVTSRTAITDDDGRFLIRNLPAGRVMITAIKSAYVATAYGAKRPGRPGTAVMLASGQQLNTTLKMTRGAVLTGVIRDRGGMPVPGIQVRAVDVRNTQTNSLDYERNFATSDDQGVYRIFGLAPSEYAIVATAPRQPGSGEIGKRSDAEVDALFAQIAQRSNRTVPGQASGTPAMSPPGTPPGAPPATTPTSPLAPAPAVGYAPVFFPGTSIFSNAMRIKLAAGEEHGGLDFPVTLVPVATVAGVVVSGTGQALATIQMTITPDGPRGSLFTGASPVLAIAPGPDGMFKYANVPPGRYAIMARSRPGDTTDANPPRPGGMGAGTPQPLKAAPGELLYAGVTIDVDGLPISGLTLSVVRGSHLSGRAVFAGTTLQPPADVTALQVNISPPEGTSYWGNGGTIMGNTFNAVYPVYAKADGTFELVNIAPGGYRLYATLPSTFAKGWWLKSAVFEGRDLLDSPFTMKSGEDMAGVVLTFSDQHTELSGTLQSAGGVPTTDYFVIAFPADRALWRAGSRRVVSARPGTDGAFAVRDLPPGNYLLAAVTDVEPADLDDVSFLEQLATASVKVTLGDGEKKTQNVRIAGGAG
jgi:hypothetical protein